MKLLIIPAFCILFFTTYSMQNPSTLEQRVTHLENTLGAMLSVIVRQNEILKSINTQQQRSLEEDMKAITSQQEAIDSELNPS